MDLEKLDKELDAILERELIKTASAETMPEKDEVKPLEQLKKDEPVKTKVTKTEATVEVPIKKSSLKDALKKASEEKKEEFKEIQKEEAKVEKKEETLEKKEDEVVQKMSFHKEKVSFQLIRDLFVGEYGKDKVAGLLKEVIESINSSNEKIAASITKDDVKANLTLKLAYFLMRANEEIESIQFDQKIAEFKSELIGSGAYEDEASAGRYLEKISEDLEKDVEAMKIAVERKIKATKLAYAEISDKPESTGKSKLHDLLMAETEE